MELKEVLRQSLRLILIIHTNFERMFLYMVNIRRLKNKPLVIIYIAVLLIFAVGTQQSAPQSVDVFAMPAMGRVIIIDAGHGGWDP